MAGRNVVRLLQILRLYRFARLANDKRLSGRRLRFYSQIVKAGDLCFDVGANFGSRTDIFLKLGARVVAVEPQRRLAEYLSKKYHNNVYVTLLRERLAESDGVRTLALCESDGASTMSTDWMRSVQSSGRFAHLRWDNSEQVAVTTLEKLVSRFGPPAFCNIDVEGYELQVIKGLVTPVQAVSFEFTSEFVKPTLEVIMRLSAMGSYLFNYSFGESMKFGSVNWVSADEIGKVLMSLSGTLCVGDVYARRIGGTRDLRNLSAISDLGVFLC